MFTKNLFSLKYQTTGKVQQPSNGKCSTPSSEPAQNEPKHLVIVMWLVESTGVFYNLGVQVQVRFLNLYL